MGDYEYFDTSSLGTMNQYPIDRDVLCAIVEETIGYETLLDVFCWGAIQCI